MVGGQAPYLSESLEATDGLGVTRSVFQAVSHPLVIPHADKVASVHVTTVCKEKGG